jgi:hypothetical protein
MGWKNGYYYSGGRTYIGGGETGLLVERLDKARRRDAERKRARARQLEQQYAQAYREARDGADRADQVASRGLIAAGFWQRERHPWQRKRKVGALTTPQVTEAAACELAALVRVSYLAKFAGRNPDIEQRLHAKLESLETELRGPAASPALRLAAELVAYCYLDYWATEMIVAGHPEQVSPALERRRKWAWQRYNAALVTVERVRRLSKPRGPLVAVQIVQEQPPCQHLPSPNIPTNSMLSEH